METLRPNSIKSSFQSIGVTKEWRPVEASTQPLAGDQPPASFQSIGVTKEWRPRCGAPGEPAGDALVSNQ